MAVGAEAMEAHLGDTASRGATRAGAGTAAARALAAAGAATHPGEAGDTAGAAGAADGAAGEALLTTATRSRLMRPASRRQAPGSALLQPHEGMQQVEQLQLPCAASPAAGHVVV